MALEIRAPAEQTEGTRSQILRWLKQVGDPVVLDEPLIEIETDKVTVEVASPGAGILREIVKGEQEEIAPGEVLGRIEVVGAEVAADARAKGAVGAGAEGATRAKGGAAGAGAEGAARAEGGAAGAGAEGAVGAGAEAATRAEGAARAEIAAGADATGSVGVGVDKGGAGAAKRGTGFAGDYSGGIVQEAGLRGADVGYVGGGTGGAVGAAPGANGNGAANFAASRFSPAVRRLLTENAIDPASLQGTGLGGRITVEDVLAAIAAGKGATVAAGKGAAAAAPARDVPGSAGSASAPRSASAGASSGTPSSSAPLSSDVTGPSRRVPHTAIRKRVAEHMVQSLLHTAPHVTTVFEADMTAVLAHRSAHREAFAERGVPLTLTAYFLQATVAAIRAVPEANSRWTDSALEIFESIHIGVGTALEEGGLVVPVLRDIQSRDLFATAEGLNDLVTRAREGRLVPTDVRGGTFTISNHGVSGSLVATPIIINQPQAAILGIGKLEKRPVVIEEGGVDRVVIRPRCYVTLTIDHRVMDGHQANRFLETFVNRIAGWPT